MMFFGYPGWPVHDVNALRSSEVIRVQHGFASQNGGFGYIGKRET